MQLDILSNDVPHTFTHGSIGTTFIKTVDGFAPPTTRNVRGVAVPTQLLSTDFIILGDGFTHEEQQQLRELSLILPKVRIFGYAYPLDNLPVGNGVSIGGYINNTAAVVFQQAEGCDYITAVLRAFRLAVTERQTFGV